MAKTGTTSESPRIALDQIKDAIATSGQRGDALRAEGLAGLVLIKRAKLIQTRRERARAAERHGEQSKRVARLDRQMALEHSFLVNSRAEADRLQTPDPTRDAKAWQVHGYLRSQDGLPRAGYAVGLFSDPEGRAAPLVRGETDKRGYFRMSLALRGKGKGKEKEKPPKDDKRPDADKKKLSRDALRERATLLLVGALKTPAFLGTTLPGQTRTLVDPRPLHPQPGAIAYRDVTVADPKDDGIRSQLQTRLLGNSGSRELHDLENEKPGCQVAEIRPDNRIYFQSEAQAEKLGYDFCTHCFGKQRSKR